MTPQTKAQDRTAGETLTWSMIHDLKTAASWVRTVSESLPEGQRKQALVTAHNLEQREQKARAYRTVTIGPIDGGDFVVMRVGDAKLLKRTTSESYAHHWAEKHGYAIHEEAN